VGDPKKVVEVLDLSLLDREPKRQLDGKPRKDTRARGEIM